VLGGLAPVVCRTTDQQVRRYGPSMNSARPYRTVRAASNPTQPTLSLGQHVMVDVVAYDNSVPEIATSSSSMRLWRQGRFSPTRPNRGGVR
jgi:hypothetical protein